MSEHTPTTDEVRDYIRAADRVTAHMFSGAADTVEAFDRWLAAHDAEVLRAAAVELEDSIHHLDPAHPSELSFINCTRIDAKLLRERADRTEARAGVAAEEPEPAQVIDERDLECVKAWPACETFGYDPRCCRFPKSCSAGVVRLVPVKQGAESSGLLVSNLVAPEVADAYSEREDADQPEADTDPVPERAIHPPRGDEHEQEQGADEQVPVELHTDDSTPDERHIRMQQEGSETDG